MTKTNETKFEYYYTKDIIIHVVCLNGRFYNGTIIEINSDKQFILLMDRKIGEIPIMFDEIKLIEPYEELK